MKTCRDCQQEKSLDDFHKHGSTKDKRAIYCKPCASARVRASSTKRTPEERAARQAMYDRRKTLKNWGLTEAKYQAMLVAQGHACAICGGTNGSKRLCVDHDHSCCPDEQRSCGGCVRGLLCTNCNRGIGMLNEDLDVMTRAIAYLTRDFTNP